ncbi:MAG TPA: hypothetical protein VJJ98_10675, partial [Sedimentisphaerales bacterium]|nr:hypothetical protein [Sedimentisphaerales bacterium]
RNNAWSDLDGTRKPSLPTPEIGGLQLPEIRLHPDALTTGTLSLKDERLKTIGADAYTRPK